MSSGCQIHEVASSGTPRDPALERLGMLVPKPRFRSIRERYREQTGLDLVLVAPGGGVLGWRGDGWARVADADSSPLRWQLVTEALRWGEPSILWCTDETVGWGFPVALNNELQGGLVVEGVPFGAEGEEKAGLFGSQILEATDALRCLALEANLCNRSWLDARREREREERRRAEGIHLAKDASYDSVREVYLRLEPALLAAIRAGHRAEARSLLNEVLAGIYYFGEDELEVLKSYLMELVVMMLRTAVAAGADSAEVLGLNYGRLSELSEIEDEEALSVWCRQMLEVLIDAIRDHRECLPSMLVARVHGIIRERLQEDLGRDEVARLVGLSPSHFSRLIKQKTGATFSRLLLEARIEKARVLLRQSEEPIGTVAEQCGFYDQSHFSKIFRRSTGRSPSAFRSGE